MISHIRSSYTQCIASLILVFGLAGCARSGVTSAAVVATGVATTAQEVSTTQAKNGSPIDGNGSTGGIATLFKLDRAMPSSDSSSASIRIVDGKRIEGRLAITSYYPNDKQILLSLLLNYQQMPFGLDDAPLSYTRFITLVGGTTREFHVTLPPLTSGSYDLAWVASPDPTLSERDFPTVVRSTFRPTSRHTLLVDTEKITPQSLPIATLFTRTLDFVTNAMFLTEKQDDFGPWPTVQLRPGQVAHIFLQIGLDERRPNDPSSNIVSSTLVAFMDYLQVPLTQGGPLVVNLHGKPSSAYVLPITIVAPNEPGTHFFFVQRFPYPFIPLSFTATWDEAVGTQTLIVDVKN